MNDDSFNRLQLLIGEDLNILKKSSVMIVGLGGVGSYAAETIARSGVENIIIIDKDIVEASNINRQLIALNSTINMPKVDVVSNRLIDINPNLKIIKYNLFLNEDNMHDIFKENKVDFVIDACDTLTTKASIIKYCLNNKIDFIISLGAANKFDATKVSVVELKNTYNDGIAKALRMLVKKEQIDGKIMCVFSDELPRKDLVEKNKKYEIDSVLGSNAFVPSSFGIICANYCFRRLLYNKY